MTMNFRKMNFMMRNARKNYFSIINIDLIIYRVEI